MRSILIALHVEANTGFAIAPLESSFFKMSETLVGSWDHIHFSYPSLKAGPPTSLPSQFNQVIEFDFMSNDPEQHSIIARYIRDHGIDTIFAFDQPVHRKVYSDLRKAGIRHFVSYWGAPMSSINSGVRLLLKRLEVALRKNGPDHYIFESYGMRDTAVYGRGVPIEKTSVVRLGVDLTSYSPDSEGSGYVHSQFGIPPDRRVFIYAGHMEERKGVHVLIAAMQKVVRNFGRTDAHLVILGNRPGEDARFVDMLDEKSIQYVTFGGYRNDVPMMLRSAYVGVIASTGWDSFPRTAVEMAASELPLLVSELPGLREVVEPGETGMRFPVGDSDALALQMISCLDDPIGTRRMAVTARARALKEFSIDKQIENLCSEMRRVTAV